MSNLKIGRLSLLFCITGILSACAGFGGETVNTPHSSYHLQTISQLDDRQRADLYEAIIAADMAEHQQDYQTAMSYYLFAADMSKDPQLINKSVESAKMAKDPLGMEQAAHLWIQVEPDNITARTLLLQSQIAQQDGDAAILTAKMLLGQFATSEERYDWLEKNVVNQEPRVTFNLLRSLHVELPQEVSIDTALAKFFMNLARKNKQSGNMLNQALKSIEDALPLNPQFVPAIRIKSHILFQMARYDEVRDFMNEAASQNPDSKEINQMLGQLLYDLRDFGASAAHYTDWLLAHPNDMEARYYLAASDYAQTLYAEALDQFKLLLSQNYKVDTVAFYCGDSALKIKQKEQAIECFKRVTDGRFAIVAKIQLAHLYADSQQFDKAFAALHVDNGVEENQRVKLIITEIDLLANNFGKAKAKERLQQALTEMPDSLALMLKKIELYELTDKTDKLLSLLKQTKSQFKPGPKLDEYNLTAATLLNNYGHSQLAIDWLNMALKAKPDDKDLLYTRAIYKEPLGLIDEMISEFKHLHTLYPDDLNIQNALGYSLADQGKELDYAAKLIQQAYEGLPDNPAVIDSKGWLAFRKGNLSEAIKFLSTAFHLSPSADIAAHLGEALWKDQKKDMALDIWQKGLLLQKDNKILLKTLERLKVDLSNN